jgi:hypothetical protein
MYEKTTEDGEVVETQDEVVHVKVFSLKGESQFL